MTIIKPFPKYLKRLATGQDIQSQPFRRKQYLRILDVTYIIFKRNTIFDEAIYTSIGTWNKSKEVVVYRTASTESAFICEKLLLDLKKPD